MPDLLELHADEKSTYVVNISFLDEDDSAVTPTSAKWTLQDVSVSGNVINSRKDVPITTPASSEDIVLQGDDLAYQSSEDGESKVLRELTMEYVYDSSIGTDNPGSSSVYFWLDRLGRYKVA